MEDRKNKARAISLGQRLPEPRSKKIAELVAIAWSTYPRFGDDENGLVAKIKAFQMALGKYPLEAIEAAFEEYFATGKQFPLPAHIREIIDPPEEKLSPAFYVELKRQQKTGVFIGVKEIDFMRKFEKQEMAKMDKSENNCYKSLGINAVIPELRDETILLQMKI